MTKEIKEYLLAATAFLSEEHSYADREKFRKEMYTRICFYQHERFIHLVVTALFAVMTLISFLISATSSDFLLLAIMFLILLIPYIWHYYFLENSVQKLYKLYYSLEQEPKPGE